MITTTQAGGSFFLTKKDQPRALAALKSLIAESDSPDELVSDPSALAASEDLSSALDAAGFRLDRDSKGDGVALWWKGGPLPSDVPGLCTLLSAIAPWVKRLGRMSLVEGVAVHFLLFDGKQLKISKNDIHKTTVQTWRNAQTAYGRERYEEALALYGEFLILALGGFSDDEQITDLLSDAWDHRNLCLSKLARWDEIAELATKEPPSCAGLASALLSNLPSTDPEGFLELGRRLFGSLPKDPSIAELLARHYFEGGESASALPYARRWVELDDSERAKGLLSDVWLALGDWKAAAALLTTLDRPQLYARALEHLGDVERARTLRTETIARWTEERADTTSGDMLAEIAFVMLDNGQAKEALALAERAQALDGGVYTQGIVGRTLVENGRLKEGIALLETALSKSPRWEMVAVALADALHQLGKSEGRVRDLCAMACSSCAHYASVVSAHPRLGPFATKPPSLEAPPPKKVAKTAVENNPVTSGKSSSPRRTRSAPKKKSDTPKKRARGS